MPSGAMLDAFSDEFRCSQCRFTARTPDALAVHLRDCHKKELCHFCKDCGRPFEKIDMLVSHMANDCTKVNIYTFECGFNDCQFTHCEPNEFAGHMKLAHRGRSLIPCKKCQQQFTLPFCLIRHMQEQCCHRPSNWLVFSAVNRPCITNQGNTPAAQPPSTTAPVQPIAPKESTSEIRDNSSFKPTVVNSSIAVASTSKAAETEELPTMQKISQKERRRRLLRRGWKSDSSDSLDDPDDPTWKPGEKSRRDRRERSNVTESNGRSLPTLKSCIASSSSDDSSSEEEDEEEDGSPVAPNFFSSWRDWAHRLETIKSQMSLSSNKIEHFYKCMYQACDFTSEEETPFHLHLIDHEVKALACTYCFQVFPLLLLAEHMTMQHGNRKYQCSCCLYRSLTSVQVKVHITEVHSGSAELLRCKKLETTRTVVPPEVVREGENFKCMVENCGFEAEAQPVYGRHFTENHKDLKVFSCFQCDKKHSSFVLLMTHLEKIHGFNNYQCIYCEYGARSSSTLINHLCINHADQKIELASRGDSDIIPSDINILNNNVLDDENNEENISIYKKHFDISKKKNLILPEYFENYCKDFVCGIDECQKQIKGIRYYRKHLQSDHGETANYPCPHCKEISKTFSLAEHHLKLHGPSLYVCASDTCGFYHWEKDLLMEHKCNSASKSEEKGTVITVRELEDVHLDYSSSSDENEASETQAVNKRKIQLDKEDPIPIKIPKVEKVSDTEEEQLAITNGPSCEQSGLVIESCYTIALQPENQEVAALEVVEEELAPFELEFNNECMTTSKESLNENSSDEGDVSSLGSATLEGLLNLDKPKTRMARKSTSLNNQTDLKKRVLSRNRPSTSPPGTSEMVSSISVGVKRKLLPEDVDSSEDSSRKAWKRTLKCNMCDTIVFCVSEAMNHLKVVHKRAFTYKCFQCDVINIKKSSMIQHVLQSHESAGEDLKEKYGFVHFSPCNETNHDEKDSFFCIFCSLTWNNAVLFKLHMYEELGYNSYRCDICNFDGVSPAFIWKHVHSEHDGNGSVSRWNYKESLEKMVESYVSNNLTKTKSYPYPSQLISVSFLKPWQCCVCAYTATSKVTLGLHLKLHLSYKPYSCSVCNQNFTSETVTRSHIKKVHSRSKKTSILVNEIEALDMWISQKIEEQEKSAFPRFAPLGIRSCAVANFVQETPKTDLEEESSLAQRRIAKTSRPKNFARKSTGGLVSYSNYKEEVSEFQAPFSYYGVKPEPISLSSIFLKVAGDVPGYNSAVRVPLYYYTDRFNFDLKLKLKDVFLNVS